MANNSSQSPDQEPIVKDTPTTIDTRARGVNNWNIGRLFWGLLFIVVGSLVLANNFHILDVNWMNVWQLWPLAIIAAGVSILSVRSWIWRILTILLMLVTFTMIVFAALADYPNVNTSPQRSTDAVVRRVSPTINNAEVTIKAGLSDLRIATADQDAIATVNLKSNHTSLTQSSFRDGDTQRISFSSEAGNGIWTGDVKSSWDVRLTRSLPLNVNVDAGASDANIDVSQAQLRSIDVDASASNLTLKLGSQEESTKINMNAGASSITIKAPKTSGIRLTLDNGLSSKQIADLVEVGKDTYESPNYSEATKKIELTGKIGVSSFTIERY
jgi:hypothetical protein